MPGQLTCYCARHYREKVCKRPCSITIPDQENIKETARKLIEEIQAACPFNDVFNGKPPRFQLTKKEGKI